MKAFVTLSLVAALSLGLATGLSAAEKKVKAGTPEPATAETKKPRDPNKPFPMYVRIDIIDAGAKTFSMKRKDGVAVKHVVPATAELKNGDKPLKFEDLKVGDWVGGLRLQKSSTDYEVLKITKIGDAPPKRGKAGATPEAKKP